CSAVESTMLFFFSSRRRHTRLVSDWSSDVCSSDLELHKKAQAAIKEHLTLEPILPGQEEAPVEVPAGFDPSAVRVTGNVTGNPPFRGVLKHHGWRVRSYKLPAPPPGVGDLVVAPAEVELP